MMQFSMLMRMAAITATICVGPPAIARELGPVSPLVQPADPIAYYQMQRDARSLVLDKQDFKAAEPLLEQLARDYPLDRMNWSLLGATKRNLGKCAQAIPAYAKSIELIGPWYSQARYFTAVCQMRLGQEAAALETLEKHVFVDGTIDRPNLYGDPEFKSLRGKRRFQRIAGVLPGTRPTRVAGYRADLDYLVAEVKRLSPHYRNSPLPARTTAAYKSLYREIPRLRDEQIYARMAQLLGTLDANHTLFRSFPNNDGKPRAERFLPLKFYSFPEGIYVVDAEEGARDLIGKKLVSIGEVPANEVLSRVVSAISAGGDAEAHWTAPQRLSEAQLLSGLGLAQTGEAVKLSFADEQGSVFRRKLQSGAKDTFSKLMPPAAVKAPLFLSRVQDPYWSENWPDLSTVYVQFNQVADGKDESLAQFALVLRKELDRTHAKNVVLDLRHNNGGNSFLYPELLRTLIAFSTQEGSQLYVLIGRNVYSAAANFSTDLERLANPIFVGEPTGDTGNQEGDEGQIRLPYSGWGATVGAVWWQLSTPWDKRRSIPPHVPVQLTAKAYFAGEDPVLDTTKKLIAARAR